MTNDSKLDVLQMASKTKVDMEKKILQNKLAKVGIYGSVSLTYRKQPIIM